MYIRKETNDDTYDDEDDDNDDNDDDDHHDEEDSTRKEGMMNECFSRRSISIEIPESAPRFQRDIQIPNIKGVKNTSLHPSNFGIWAFAMRSERHHPTLTPTCLSACK